MKFVGTLLLGFVGFANSATAGGKIDFDRAVAPILAEHCLDCHSGPRSKGKLDLTRAKSAFLGGKNGPGVIAGKLDDSQVWLRVAANEMPPKKPLAAAEKAVLKQWIESGASWGGDPIDPFRVTTKQRAGYDWWSLRPIVRPPLPEIKNRAWANNPVDHFVLKNLEMKGLAPSPDADRRTLIRRLSLDLLGLPPTWDDVEAFVRDDRPEAYERLVDRLLASPHYGERWARHWLDVVRFGESTGFERNDPRRTAWHYRDWVIRALNADMRFDDFCRLQLAGDMLRPGDSDTLKATGYLVAGIHNTVLPNLKSLRDAAFQDELEDIVGNVGQTFLGMTIHCSRCHDHKFDPISQVDYYRIASALSGVQHGEREITLPRTKDEIDRLTKVVGQLERQLAAIEEPARKAIAVAQGAGVSAAGPAPMAAWDFRVDGRDRIGSLHVQLHGAAKLTPEGLRLDGTNAFARTPALSRDLRAKTLEAWVRLDKFDQRGGGVITLQTLEGATFDAIVFGEQEPGKWMAGSDSFRRTASFQGTVETEAVDRPVHVAIAYHADGTIAAYRDGKPYGRPYTSKGPLTFAKDRAVIAFGVRHEPAGGNRMLAGVVTQVRLYDHALSAIEVATSAQAKGVVSEGELIAHLDPAARLKRQELRLGRLVALAELAKTKERLQPLKVYAVLSQQPEPTRLLHRGQVADPGEVIAPEGLSALGAKSKFGLSPASAEGKRREKLAEWITATDNPLFARVLVNRLWHYHFGIGLVETPNDFGFNGSRPSHPELLDWLAAEFANREFKLKDMHRLLVTSRTYRQASVARLEGLAADAESRLLWRKRPMRVEGEVLRDSLLAVTGLLNRDIGGQGFNDYRETSGFGTVFYDPIDPEGWGFQRRSIYRFQPRGANLGLLDAFDCPDPAAAAPRRNTTTTPLQALTLWNGAFTLRMAEALVQRLQSASPELENQVTLAYRLVLQRDPLPAERTRADRLVRDHGLRVLARALFNSNEFLSIE